MRAPEEPATLPAGQDTVEPVYGAPARWVSERDQEKASLAGATLVTPTEILATHLLEIVKRNFSRLLTLKSLRRLLAEMVNVSDPARAEANRKLLDELIPDKVPTDVLHAVLRLLLDEQVSIRHLPLILEATAPLPPIRSMPSGGWTSLCRPTCSTRWLTTCRTNWPTPAATVFTPRS